MSEATAAWRDLCERLAVLGDEIDRREDPRERAEGIRHLSRLTVMAVQSFVEHGDVDFPSFHRYDDDVVKWGGPNVDNQYLRARIDPNGTYRLVGDVRAVRDLIVSVHEGDMALEQYGVYGERRLDELTIGADGRVELRLGGDPPATGNHLPLDPRATLVLVRVYVADWTTDGLPWFTLERLDRPLGAPAPLTERALGDALTSATTWVEASARYWPRYLEESPARRVVNRLTPPRRAPGGSDRIAYGAGWWELTPRECLLVELPDPAADYWSFQLYASPWFESLDTRNRVVSASDVTATADPDGVVRLVVAGRDPGLVNWLDTEGRPHGMVSYRFIGARHDVTPTAQVVPIAELDAVVPDAPRLDAVGRAVQIASRREGVARRFHR